MYIATHTNPDFDAIGGVWLLKRFGGLDKAEVRFVNTGNPDREVLAKAEAVIDTGKEYDPSYEVLRFDHHHLPGQAANDTCATMQVFGCVYQSRPELIYLKPLVDLIFAGDTGRSEANQSRELGLHAIFSGWKAWYSEQNPDERLPDAVILAYGMSLLDMLEVRLRKQAEAHAELAQKVVYKSDDGLLWAIRHGSQGSTFAAYEEGARLVLFEGEPLEIEGGTTYPIGLMRAGEWTEPHAGKIIQTIIDQCDYELASGAPGNYSLELSLKEELSRWFLHPAGFFSGRGTAKAPVFEPVAIQLGVLAEIVDTIWKR